MFVNSYIWSAVIPVFVRHLLYGTQAVVVDSCALEGEEDSALTEIS